MSLLKKFPANIWREGKVFVADCPVLGIASQGINKEEAIVNLKEAIELYFEDQPLEDEVTFDEFFTTQIEVEFAS